MDDKQDRRDIVTELHQIIKRYAAAVGCNNLCAGEDDTKDQCENCNLLVGEIYIFAERQLARERRRMLADTKRSIAADIAMYADSYYLAHKYDRVQDGKVIRPITARELFNGFRHAVYEMFADKK